MRGTLHAHVAFDWGEELRLDVAQRLVPAELHGLARRPRTPSSFAFRPTPLRVVLEPIELQLAEVGSCRAAAQATLFDFAAVSLALRVPFELPRDALARLAGSLSNSETIAQVARRSLEPLFHQLRPAIDQPEFIPLSEEYFVFQFAPGALADTPATFMAEQAEWLAALLRLEDEPLCGDEVAEAVRQRLSYGPDDAFMAEWSAAVLVDADCEETLQTIEFANLQLLELRHIDMKLDNRLASAYQVIHPLARSAWPFWRLQSRQLRAMGELRIAAHEVYQRTTNVLKLVGDPYLARVYRMLAARFHLESWQKSVEQSLDVVESVHQTVSDQAATYRTETLEWIIILLILIEIVMSLTSH